MRNGASDKLSRGEYGDFYDVLRLVEQEYHEELGPYVSDPEDGSQFLKTIEEAKKACEAAFEVYQRHMEEAKQKAAEEMLQGDEWLRSFGQALLSGDYSRLAI
ncbi:MAG TPA: hypothetical protein VFA10_17975 [Ktedonobacteraceae bacterium]|nr:hypothetical protein [Ktedonobacteraceae bacterium]